MGFHRLLSGTICNTLPDVTRTIAEVGAIFRDRRNDLGLTQQQVIEIAQAHFGHKVVGESTYRQFESGRAEGISDRTARGAAVALSWPKEAVQRLLGGEDPATFPDVDHDDEERPPPWEQLLEGQQRISDRLERLAEILERDQ